MATADPEIPAAAPGLLADNPLVEGLERLPVRSTAFVIFGATGDLAGRKLLPALYNLAHEGALPEHIEIAGVARGTISDQEFRDQAREAITRFSRRRPNPDVLDGLIANIRFVGGAFDEADLYARLREVLEGFDSRCGEPLNRIFYLSTAPQFFPVITGAL